MARARPPPLTKIKNQCFHFNRAARLQPIPVPGRTTAVRKERSFAEGAADGSSLPSFRSIASITLAHCLTVLCYAHSSGGRALSETRKFAAIRVAERII
jgi:hypothetical protein